MIKTLSQQICKIDIDIQQLDLLITEDITEETWPETTPPSSPEFQMPPLEDTSWPPSPQC